MPFRKKLTLRKRGAKPALKTIAKKVNRISKAMRGIVTHTDETQSGLGMHATGQVVQICNIGGGTGEGQRHGNTCSLKSLTVSGVVTSNVSNVQNQYGRFVVAMRKSNPELQTPAVTDVFTDPTRPYAPLSPYVFGDYKILYDKKISFNAGQVTQAENKMFSKTISLKDVKQEYQSNSSATCENNGLYIFICGNVATGSQPMTVSFLNRLNFYP